MKKVVNAEFKRRKRLPDFLEDEAALPRRRLLHPLDPSDDTTKSHKSLPSSPKSGEEQNSDDEDSRKAQAIQDSYNIRKVAQAYGQSSLALNEESLSYLNMIEKPDSL